MRGPATPASAVAAAFASGLLPAGSRLLLAVSGGPDSVALLEAFRETASRFDAEFGVGHVDHGWRGAASRDDAEFVRRRCADLDVPFFLRAGRPDAAGRSREAAAREFRYSALREMAAEFGARGVVTAHTRDDAAETLLLALLRGRPLPGLSGIRESRDDGVLRPMLSVSRGAVLAYLRSRRVSYRRDASNADEALDRNWLRRRILPLLDRRLGGEAAANLAASAEALARDREWLDQIYRRDVHPALRFAESGAEAPLAELAGLPPAALRRVILGMTAAAGGVERPPTRRELLEIERRIAAGAPFRFQVGRRVDIVCRRGVVRAEPARAKNGYKMPRKRKKDRADD